MNIRSHLSLKAAAVMLAAGGLGLGLIGSGVRAAFTDAGHATESISVGGFGITLLTSSPNCVAGGVSGAWTVTCTPPAITSGAASSAPFSFSVKDTGTIAGTFSVSAGVITGQVAGATQFTDTLVPVVNQAIASGATSAPISAGLAWGALVSGNQGQSASVVYTITATA